MKKTSLDEEARLISPSPGGRVAMIGFWLRFSLLGLGCACQAQDDTPRPVVLASTPLLAQLVKEVAGDTVDARSVWAGVTPPAEFEMSKEVLSNPGSPVLFVQYGESPYQDFEGAIRRALPKETHVVTATGTEAVTASGVPVLGERALDPVWSFWASRAVLSELTKAFPGAEKQFQANLAAFHSRLAQAMFGKESPKKAEMEKLFGSVPEGRLASPRHDRSDAGKTGWYRRLTPFAGITVHDPWKVLGAFCGRFGLVPIGAEQARAEKGKLSFPVFIGWEKEPLKQRDGTLEIVSVALDPGLLSSRGSNGIAGQIASLIAALEPALAASRVRRVCARAGTASIVKPEVALTFDERCVPELVRLLSESETAGWWCSVILLLGYIQDERAFDPLANLMTNRFTGKTVTDETENAILFAPRGLGLLAKKSEKALAFIEKGCSRRFWREHITWDGTVLERQAVISGLAGRCIQAVGISGKRNHGWLMEFARSQSQEDAMRDWYSIFEADWYLWWQETYGEEQFRLEWGSEKHDQRFLEYLRLERAAEMKRLAPKGLPLPR
jgi:hypothetical protein